MRILKILGGNDKGGVYTCEKQYIKYWRSKGIQVDGIILGGGSSIGIYKKLLNNSFVFPSLNAQYHGGIIKTLSGIIQSYYYPFRVFKNFNLDGIYDAIIYRTPQYIHVAGMLKRKLNTNGFWHMPSSVNKKTGRFYYVNFLNKYGLKPVANSEFTKNSIGKICKYVVYPGFSSDRTQKTNDNFKEELGISEDALVFGSASRINYTKALDLVINGMIKAHAFDYDVHLIIAGGPTDSQYAKLLKDISKEYRDKIHFIGLINDMNKFYSTIDIYVNGRRDAEPFGISVAESLGASIPAIAYYLGGPSEMIEEGQNGWLIKEATTESYSKTFTIALKNRNQWNVMGEKSRVLSKQFSASVNAEKFLNIIENVKNN